MELQTNSYNFCRCSVISYETDDKPGNGKAALLRESDDGKHGTEESERWLVGVAGSDPATVELWEVMGLVRAHSLAHVHQ